jgi:hypothetical protein
MIFKAVLPAAAVANAERPKFIRVRQVKSFISLTSNGCIFMMGLPDG